MRQEKQMSEASAMHGNEHVRIVRLPHLLNKACLQIISNNLELHLFAQLPGQRLHQRPLVQNVPELGLPVQQSYSDLVPQRALLLHIEPMQRVLRKGLEKSSAMAATNQRHVIKQAVSHASKERKDHVSEATCHK